jgi:hypothetical protein
MDDYLTARDKYNPKLVKPTHKIPAYRRISPAGGGFFYFERATGRGNLFRETMKALEIPIGKMPQGYDKSPQLRQFQSRGFF